MTRWTRARSTGSRAHECAAFFARLARVLWCARGGARVEPGHCARREAGPGGRVRLGQNRLGPGAAGAGARGAGVGPGSVGWARFADAVAAGHGGCAGQRNRHDFSRAHDGAEPAFHSGRTNCRSAAMENRPLAQRRLGPRRGAAGGHRHHRTRAPRRRLPAPDQRRPAPARHDRHGPGLCAQAAAG